MRPRKPGRRLIDRRAFLKAGGIALVTAGAGPAFLGRTALASTPVTTPGRRKVLVTIFQRGAMDGLAAVSPVGEEARMRALRPRLAMSAARSAGSDGLIDLGVGFALHPALAPLVPLFRDGDLAIVHAVGSPHATRSHFDAQDFMESGTPGLRGTPDGWLNRVAGRLGHDASPLRALALTPSMPRSLAGPAPALAVADLDALRMPAAIAPINGESSQMEALYGSSDDRVFAATAREAAEAMRLLARIDLAAGERSSDGRGYPETTIGASLRQIAALIKADVGLEVAFAETSGWDTHVLQGTATGSFARRAEELARAVAAFFTDLGSRRDDVVLMTMTEFGRGVIENGSGGTDHGHGSCLFVVGGGVDGGKVHGTFPSLDPAALTAGRDLPVTTDFRSVFAEVAGHHLGVADATAIFPGWSGPRLALWRSALQHEPSAPRVRR